MLYLVCVQWVSLEDHPHHCWVLQDPVESGNLVCVKTVHEARELAPLHHAVVPAPLEVAVLGVDLNIGVPVFEVAPDELVLIVLDAVVGELGHEDGVVDGIVGSAEVSAEDDPHVVVLEGLGGVVVDYTLGSDSGMVLETPVMFLQEDLVGLDVGNQVDLDPFLVYLLDCMEIMDRSVRH